MAHLGHQKPRFHGHGPDQAGPPVPTAHGGRGGAERKGAERKEAERGSAGPSAPADIERGSMEIIRRELSEHGIVLPEETAAVVERAIHATADFDYARTLRFTPEAVAKGSKALRGGTIVTDTEMARAGISKAALRALGAETRCLIGDPIISIEAKHRGKTRASVAAEHAVKELPGAVLVVGNAPTALLRIAELIEKGKARPALVIGAPVGFVNVVESKERALAVCEAAGIPAIVALGRKGGSTVAAAICNALLYTEAGLLDPSSRT